MGGDRRRLGRVGVFARGRVRGVVQYNFMSVKKSPSELNCFRCLLVVCSLKALRDGPRVASPRGVDRGARNLGLDALRPRSALQTARPARTPKSTGHSRVRENMPSVASFMMPAAKCVTAMPEDKLSSVVTSLVNEKIGCVVVVDPAAERAVGIVTKQDVNRMFLNQVRTGVRRGRRHRTPSTRRGGSTRFPGGVLPAPRFRRARDHDRDARGLERGRKLRLGASEASGRRRLDFFLKKKDERFFSRRLFSSRS